MHLAFTIYVPIGWYSTQHPSYADIESLRDEIFIQLNYHKLNYGNYYSATVCINDITAELMMIPEELCWCFCPVEEGIRVIYYPPAHFELPQPLSPAPSYHGQSSDDDDDDDDNNINGQHENPDWNKVNNQPHDSDDSGVGGN